MSKALGRYELVRPLARGGMAEVFLARRRAGGVEKLLVVKRIRAERANDVRFQDLFKREAKLSMSLAHQNIVPVFDFGRIGDRFFLAMERVEGKDLGSSLGHRVKEPLPPLVAAFIAAECCQALDYAHRRKNADGTSRNIVHRDVTPRNVLLSWSGEVKLTDFGIASLAGEDASKLVGTPAYMAPEQARGEPVDVRTDVYGLGLVLREALTGIRGRPGESHETLIAAARSGTLSPWPATPELDPALVAIADRATAAQAEDRYAEVHEMLADLDAYIVAERAKNRGDSPAKQIAAWLGRVWGDAREESAEEAAASAEQAPFMSFLDDGDGLDAVGTGTQRSLAATAADEEVPATASTPEPASDAKPASSAVEAASGAKRASAAAPELAPASAARMAAEAAPDAKSAAVATSGAKAAAAAASDAKSVATSGAKAAAAAASDAKSVATSEAAKSAAAAASDAKSVATSEAAKSAVEAAPDAKSVATSEAAKSAAVAASDAKSGAILEAAKSAAVAASDAKSGAAKGAVATSAARSAAEAASEAATPVVPASATSSARGRAVIAILVVAAIALVVVWIAVRDRGSRATPDSGIAARTPDAAVVFGSDAPPVGGSDAAVVGGADAAIVVAADADVAEPPDGGAGSAVVRAGSAVRAGSGSAIRAGSNAIVRAGSGSAVRTGSGSAVAVGSGSAVRTGSGSAVTVGSGSAVRAGSGSAAGSATPVATRKVHINATPWAYFTVDGGPKMQTPKLLELTPGPHRIHFENSVLKVERDITLDVPADRDISYVEPLR